MDAPDDLRYFVTAKSTCNADYSIMKIQIPFIDPCLVENTDLFEKIKDILICQICLGIILNPKTCDKCESSFCENCINLWNKEYQAKSSCPYKCKDPNFKDPSRILKKNLELITLKCPQECGKSFGYNEFLTHCKICDGMTVCWNCGQKSKGQNFKYDNKSIYHNELELKLKVMECKYKTLSEEFEKFKKQQGLNNVVIDTDVKNDPNLQEHMTLEEHYNSVPPESGQLLHNINSTATLVSKTALDCIVNYSYSTRPRTRECPQCREQVRVEDFICEKCFSLLD